MESLKVCINCDKYRFDTNKEVRIGNIIGPSRYICTDLKHASDFVALAGSVDPYQLKQKFENKLISELISLLLLK